MANGSLQHWAWVNYVMQYLQYINLPLLSNMLLPSHAIQIYLKDGEILIRLVIPTLNIQQLVIFL